MLNRPTRIQTFMEVAAAFAKRSTCMRRNVGAIIVLNRTIVGHGYNGAPSGEDHCLGNYCPGKLVCERTDHAEDNALRRAGVLAQNADMFTTDSPCPRCAELLFGKRIKRVFFMIPYRITGSLDMLVAWGVGVYQVAPAGYIMEWATKNIVEIEL